MQIYTLTTYGTYNESDDTTEELVFSLAEDTLDKLIKKEGWKSIGQFLNEYIYDSSLPIYEMAKAMNAIIEEKEVAPFDPSELRGHELEKYLELQNAVHRILA